MTPLSVSRAFVLPVMLLALLLIDSPSVAFALRHTRSPATLHPLPRAGNIRLPLPPKSCETDDPLAGLEQLAGPDVQGDRSRWEMWLQELKTWRSQVHQLMEYSDARYALFPWTQRNLVAPQMHPFDQKFFTQVSASVWV
jgi:hypothetical protein